MREIRPSGSEGGVRSIPHPYPYRTVDGSGAVRNAPPLSDLKSHQFEIFKTSRARHSVRAVVANPNASVGRHRPR